MKKKDFCVRKIFKSFSVHFCLAIVILSAICTPVVFCSVSYYGTVTGGGGTSSNSGYSLTGSISLIPAAESQNSGVSIISGINPIFCVNHISSDAFYSGLPQEIIEIEDRTVSIQFDDSIGCLQAYFLYRPGGAVYFGSLEMQLNTNGCDIIIPGSLLTLRGLEYYFTLITESGTLKIGSENNPYRFIVSTDNNALAQSPYLPPALEYRIIGLPFNPTNPDPTAVFADDYGPYDPAQWRLGYYNSEINETLEYPNIPNIAPGQGYWLITRRGSTFGSPGHSVLPNTAINGYEYFCHSLDSGWNMLANPFMFDISWEDVAFIENGRLVGHYSDQIEDAAFIYGSGGYYPADIIFAGQGFFIKSLSDKLEILFKYSETQSQSLNKHYIAEFDWHIELTLISDNIRDGGNIAGVITGASDNLDNFDLSKPPAAPNSGQLYFKISGENKEKYLVDIRSPSNEIWEWNITFQNTGDQKLILTPSEKFPDDLEIRLHFSDSTVIEPIFGREIPIPEKARSARLIIGATEYVTQEPILDLPDRFILNQNYPNPFNPWTRITFAIPEADDVRLEILNILGRQVDMLVDNYLPAGYHSIYWDGLDSGGSPVSSGIYFYRITTPEYFASRKMLLLK